MRPEFHLAWRPALPALTIVLTLAVFFSAAIYARAAPPQMSASQAMAAAEKGEIVLIDIRRPDEWEQTGIGRGAIPLDMRGSDFVATVVKIHQANPDRPVALICAVGGRSGYVTRYLEENGVTGVIDIAEGMFGSDAGKGWLKEGLPVYRGTEAEYRGLVEAVAGAL